MSDRIIEAVLDEGDNAHAVRADAEMLGVNPAPKYPLTAALVALYEAEKQFRDCKGIPRQMRQHDRDEAYVAVTALLTERGIEP